MKGFLVVMVALVMLCVSNVEVQAAEVEGSINQDLGTIVTMIEQKLIQWEIDLERLDLALAPFEKIKKESAIWLLNRQKEELICVLDEVFCMQQETLAEDLEGITSKEERQQMIDASNLEYAPFYEIASKYEYLPGLATYEDFLLPEED